MDHSFTPPARIPASLPKPKTPKAEKKSKAEYFGILPANSDAHLTEDELQQLTRSSMEATRPIFSRSQSRESRESHSSRSSVNYDRRYDRSGSSMPVNLASRKSTSAAGLTVLDLMQAQYSSSNNGPSPYSHTKDTPYVTGLDVQLMNSSPPGAFSSATSDNRGRDLKYSHDGPLTPAPISIPAGSSKHLTGAALRLPKDEVPESVAHLIGVNFKLPDNGGPVIQSPFPVTPHHIDELEKSASVAALLLEKMESKPAARVVRLPIDDSTAPTPPPLPYRKDSAKTISSDSSDSVIITPTVMTAAVYEMIPPPSVVNLISNLGSQGDSSSDPNWPLPAKTPVYTFIPPPPSQSPIESSLEASIPSNIPSPIGSPVTATQQLQVNSFIPPPHTVPVGSPATPIQELPDNFSMTTPQTVFRIASPAPVTQQIAVGDMIPPSYGVATSAAPYNRPLSTTLNSMAYSSQIQQGVRANPASIAPYSQSVSSGLHSLIVHNPEPDAVAAARAAYSHAYSTQPPNTDVPSQPSSYMPPTMASRYRNSVDYNQPNNSQSNTTTPAYSERIATNAPPSSPFTQPAAYMPPSKASHYRESSAVAEAKAAYDQPSNTQLYAAAVSERDAPLVGGLKPPRTVPYSQPAAYMPAALATHYRESSAVTRAEGIYDKTPNSGGNNMQKLNSGRAVPGALYGAIAGFNQAFNAHGRPQTPVELSAVHKAPVQSPIPRVPVPLHGGTPNNSQKPQPMVILSDAALSPQPPFRNKSTLNHSPNLHPNSILHGQPPTVYSQQLNTYTRNPIDRQLPVNAPSLHIETVPSFPRPVAKEASFWRRRKKALIILLVIVLLGIGVGIIFVAHSFYTRWGGVGFLRKRQAGELDGKVGYARMENGEVWEHQKSDGGDENQSGQRKGLMENMLVGGYKRGWGTDYKGEDNQSPPKEAKDLKKFPHIVQVIPVGSTPHLASHGSPYDIGSSWWNDRINEMHKRGEEIISSHPKPEDVLKQASVLAQRFVEEIKARMEGNGPFCPPACRSESDVEIAKVLASDYVSRVPIDVANEYDIETLMSSMDSVEMERPAQEVAMLAAQQGGYVARVPKDVQEMQKEQERQKGLNARDVLAKENIGRLMSGRDVTEPERIESVTVTVTETKVSTGAPTGLSQADQAKQFASGYVDSPPREVEIKLAGSSVGKRNAASASHEVEGVKLAESLAAKRWAARKASAEVPPWPSLGANAPQEDATNKAGEYARHVPNGQPLSECEKAKVNAGFYSRQLKEDHVTLTKRLAMRNVMKPAELMAAAFFGVLKLDKEGEGEPVHERAKRNAGHYARQAPKGPVERLASLFIEGLKSEEDAGRWSDDGKSGKKRDSQPCGEGRNGCEAQGHPEICCPPAHTCHKSPTTNSGIICCEGTEDCSSPKNGDDAIIQASCPSNFVACPVEAGGGCCEVLDQCAPKGCLEFEQGYSPSDVPLIAITETRSITIIATDPPIPDESKPVAQQGATITRTVTQLVGGDVRVKATKVKDGEVVLGPEETFGSGAVVKPQGLKPKSEAVERWGGTRWMVWKLGFVAIVMGML